jgi:hypothetical protein
VEHGGKGAHVHQYVGKWEIQCVYSGKFDSPILEEIRNFTVQKLQWLFSDVFAALLQCQTPSSQPFWLLKMAAEIPSRASPSSWTSSTLSLELQISMVFDIIIYHHIS